MTYDLTRLRKRERQIAEMMVDGSWLHDIADRIGIEKTTVITHMDNAYNRLGFPKGAELSCARLLVSLVATAIAKGEW